MKPIITKLCADHDPDVRYFADETKVALGLEDNGEERTEEEEEKRLEEVAQQKVDDEDVVMADA